MINELKKIVIDKGVSLMQSEKVTKVLSNEQVGAVVEKAMTIPFKLSNAVTAQKERLVALFDLATQEDIDDIRRSVARVEDALKGLKKESSGKGKKTANQ